MKLFRNTVLSLMMAGTLTLPALAADSQPSIISYAGIRMVVDGDTIVPKDADGNPAEPFLYEDTTYLPVRALANSLGLTVEWDANDGTIRLKQGNFVPRQVGNPPVSRGTRQAALNFQEPKLELNGRPLTLKTENGLPVQAILYGDTTYLPLRPLANALGLTVQWESQSNTVYIGEQVRYLLSRKSQRTQDGNASSTTEYRYDEAGNILSVMTQDQHGQQTINSYTYDEQGHCTATDYTDSQGQTTHTEYTCELDQKGNCIRETATTDSGAQTTTTRTYDSHGNCVSEIKVNPSGEEESYGRTYDNYGDLISQRHVSELKTETETYTYNNARQVALYQYQLNSSLTLTVRYEFNDNGQAVRSIMESEDGSTLVTEYTYDIHGNLISSSNAQAEITYTYQAVK